jgi:hypothetical protein
MHDQPCTGTIRDAPGSGKEPDRALTPEKCQRFQPEEIRAISLVDWNDTSIVRSLGLMLGKVDALKDFFANRDV